MIRPATADDVPAIARLIRGLADYEKLSDVVTLEEDRLREHLLTIEARERRPAQLWLLVSAYALAGVVLLVVAAVAAGGGSL